MNAPIALVVPFLFWTSFPVPQDSALPDANDKFEDAIRALRGLSPEIINIDPRREAEWRKIWNEISTAKGVLSCPAGVSRLTAELEALDRTGMRNDVFRILACDVLASHAPVEQSELIARTLENVDPGACFDHSVIVCIRMAKTRRPEALPSLRLALRVDPAKHVFRWWHLPYTFYLDWPVFLEFIYGAYGPDSARDVLTVLEKTKEEPEARSCLYVLDRFRYLSALPAIRELARSAVGRVREDAIFRLGRFACPEDRRFLESCLLNENARIRYAAAAALWEACPPESVPALAERLWMDKNADVRAMAAAVLVRLAEPEALVNCRDYLLHGQDHQAQDVIEKLSGSFGRPMGAGFRDLLKITLEDFKAANDARIADMSRSYWELHDGSYTLKAGEAGLSPAKLLAAMREWEESKSVLGRDGEWLGHQYFAAAADVGEVEALLCGLFRCRARLFERISDEAFYQARILDQVIDLLHRRRVGAKRRNLWATVEYAPFLARAAGDREICWWSLLPLVGGPQEAPRSSDPVW